MSDDDEDAGQRASRSRRKTAKKVNYAKEQEFSDEDLFEDSDNEAPTQRGRKPRGSTGRRSKGSAANAAAEDTGIMDETGRFHYTEKGYDPSQQPLRQRYHFLPEYEEDGSAKIELIVGRRPIDEKEDVDASNNAEGDDESEGEGGRSTRSKKAKKPKLSSPKKGEVEPQSDVVEYEYLVKYKGRSYLHLDWLRGADLDSMNKSAKGIYRRYLKKIAQGVEEDLENPEFDPAYVTPQKICDEKEQEITVELTDKELLKWEKQREKELAEAADDDEDEEEEDKTNDKSETLKGNEAEQGEKEGTKDNREPWADVDEVVYSELDIEKLRRIIDSEGPYYQTFEGSNNPYRDGHLKEAPRKPRASYLFFQGTMRGYFTKKNPGATQAELMTMMGNTWQTLSEEERRPFIELAQEESKQYQKETVLLAKAQRPTEVWQPLRRCLMVLDHLSDDSFAEIFLEPVDANEFTDYEEIIDSPMDLSTVRTRLSTRKYQAPEQFARDMRKIWNNCKIYNMHGSAIWHVADYMSKLFERLYHAWVLDFRNKYVRWAEPRARPWDQPFKLSVAEKAARKRAELGDVPKKKMKQIMYLVKWSGLGYEHCTWETRTDVNDDALITAYRRLNKGSVDESHLPTETVEKLLSETKHVYNEISPNETPLLSSLKAQWYAQTRAFQFTRFGSALPPQLGVECGAKSSAVLPGPVSDQMKPPSAHAKPVVECVYDMLFQVERGFKLGSDPPALDLPPLLRGEYDAIIPITSKGLLMNVGEIHGSVAFLGYRQFPDGTKGPAEESNLIRGVGDKIIAVDGNSTIGKSFKEVISMLRESGKNKYAYMRFLENRYAACQMNLPSVGTKGRYAIEELRKKFAYDRQRAIVERGEDGVDQTDLGPNDDPDAEEEDDDSEASDGGSEGEFQPDSDDEDLVARGKSREVMSDSEDNESQHDEAEELPDKKITGEQQQDSPPQNNNENDATGEKPTPGIISQHENTRSLGYRLLDTDLGYSSDEGGDEDGAFFLDGVDGTFAKQSDLSDAFGKQSAKGKMASKSKTIKDTLPAKQGDFLILGDHAKLACASAIIPVEPKPDEFDNYPLRPEQDEQQSNEEDDEQDQTQLAKELKRSTVKVEQLSITTGETIHVWANIEAAAATLQLRLDQLKQVLSGEYDEELGDEVGGYKWRYAAAGAKVTAGANQSRGAGGKKAKEAWLEFREKLYDPHEPHPYKNNNRLRDYQVDGVNWLASTWYKKQGGILADEMGLGKTVQIVCYIEHIYRAEKLPRPYLVVVPLSTVEHWRREFEGWTDMVCCVYHDRQRVWRDIMREYEWYYEDRPHTPEFLKFDVLVTTYDTLISDFDVVSQIPFRIAVVDEAHRLRNQKGKLLECMREISAKGTMQYGFQSRILISGTPLQNDLTELWTLLNFIEPFKFPSLDNFQHNFGNMASREQVESLQQMISPFMLRRVKEDVAKDIPAKEETVIDVELTSIQKQYYRAIFEHNLAFLNMGGRQTAPKLMNIQMELRKVCNHPYLLDGIEHRESERLFKEFLEKGDFQGKSGEEQQHMLNEHGYIMTSGKMVLLDKLLPRLREEGHKVLIFSQMVKMLDLLTEYCEFRNFKFERLDGRIRGAERQKAIDRFEREDDSFIFMLSTRAGGVGINLTAADICIIFDSDWNPQNDVQAQARCHRIGQSKEVKVFRLITSRSFEQEMFERASKKLGLEQAVLGTFEKDMDDDKPTQKEMEQLLKKGAYALLEDDNDAITQEFCTDDIDAILAKRSRTRVVEGAKTSNWLNKQGMVVSKSKFTAEEGGPEMDDPDFWRKVMPDFVTPSIMMQKLNELIDEIEGRVRGPGRGRGRKKRDADGEKNDRGENGSTPSKASQDEERADQDAEATPAKATAVEEAEEDDEDDNSVEEKKLSRTNVRKVHKFMSDMKGMMQGILDEEDDDALSADEKDKCQKMLLTISVKEKIFNESQRRDARHFLKRMEGDRRRRCRTSDAGGKPPPRNTEDDANAIPEELRIAGRKRKTVKRRKRGEDEDEEERTAKKRKRTSGGGEYVGEDGYLHHSDSEADWSDVGEDIYNAGGKKKDTISRKEARRRRTWGADDDAATAAGRAWPVFPRHVVKKVLASVLEEVMKYDEENGGVFSEPVSKEDFPEYFEQIQKPMDYSTMKKKLENGEYRSAQAMQKDFILILQNCRTFNATTSDIVKEARRQHLMRPGILKQAAAKHDLFLAEDGAVLEITDEDSKKGKKGKKKGEGDDGKPTPKKKKALPKATKNGGKAKSADPDETETDESQSGKGKEEATPVRKPRIRIKMTRESNTTDSKKKPAPKRKRVSDSGDEKSNIEDAMPEPIPKRSKKKDNSGSKTPSKKKSADQSAAEKKRQVASSKLMAKKAQFFSLSNWKKSKSSLDGTFKAARNFLTSQGPWSLPTNLAAERFTDVAKDTLAKLKKVDRYSVFADPVSEDEAPGYFEIIENPMDFATMREKVTAGGYGSGSAAAAEFFKDILLIFDNCLLYNDEDGEIAEEAIRIMGLVPETFVSSCLAIAKKSK
mmetsp:Transcript_3607/g.9944  ORF Transcript_3607/g.9944 Transcript_3607/m.9944 type:complete len:2529 (-) Transcript_3607:88-7674(-)